MRFLLGQLQREAIVAHSHGIYCPLSWWGGARERVDSHRNILTFRLQTKKNNKRDFRFVLVVIVCGCVMWEKMSKYLYMHLNV